MTHLINALSFLAIFLALFQLETGIFNTLNRSQSTVEQLLAKR